MVKALWIGTFIQLLVGLVSGDPPKLPYNPSYIWVPSSENGSSLAYILLPTSQGSNELQLQAFNISAPFDTSAPPLVNVRNKPPFLSNNGIKSIIPLPNKDGVPMVYAGDCESGAAQLWRFVPDARRLGEGTWSNLSLKEVESKEGLGRVGPNNLAAAITFPALTRGNLFDVYVFGGMCPVVGGEAKGWMSKANYSREMIVLDPTKSPGDGLYLASMLSSRSPPVRQAGSTITPLLPTHSNSSTGNQLRQQRFALVGGHTQDAFIDMSRIALFSLPEGTWSYVPITNLPTSSGQQSVRGIEPRSGHTAILAPGGDKLIILGGWVGDITEPAQPQLAVLHLGEDYGGSGEWAWSIPKDSSPGIPKGIGIFGHGAAILPGGIMAVVGGYEISRSSKRSVLERRDNTQVYLFNMTSESWITSYAPPEKPGPVHSPGPLSSMAQKAGLGVGLGVGISAAMAALVFLFCARTRHRRVHKRNREQELRKLALGAERPHMNVSETPSGLYQPMLPATPSRPRANSHHDSDWNDKNASAAERTSLLVDTTPTRTSVGMASKTYQPAGYSDDLRRPSTLGIIHPIDEGEEYGDYPQAGTEPSGARGTHRHSKSSAMSDPFRDPPSPVKACLSPQMIIPPRSVDSSNTEWAHGHGSNVMTPAVIQGRRTDSLSKTDRTLSGLSESSGSTMSTSSYRTNSMGLNQMSAFRHSSLPLIEMPEESAFSLELLTNELKLRSDKTSNEKLSRPESGSLLGSSLLPSETGEPPVQSKSKALDWVGSVRRALSFKRSDTSDSSLANSDPPLGLERSSSSSPTKSFYSAQEHMSGYSDDGAKPPRRAFSTNSSALQRKQGAKDWNVKRSSTERSTLLRRGTYEDALSAGRRTGGSSSKDMDSPALAGYDDEGDDEEEDDWDVEAAAEGRVVQVTFTVPKEKLRVVNAGAGDGLDDDDDGNDHGRNNAATASKQ
ncbi:hypothetical protein LOZ61_002547 [Ophidiomyces ophidiicola]|uniref:Uncharacterized protein n=1 Tax=Ophidiomyces ophidiicola TaxID=1387563 RepID=A0ACB8V131_9EURO|nr:uncharacterized protein LOZ57_002180 [Ophidiomyces ophidiicola]KAI1913892.1 hypothetical protein LOZ61_002547 [Ophidiomyces ophidiicola]KAI1916795.1 hypothetical protein LOZ64_003256 [Ophidiomyces ophidiicola]KAI1927869.1 hypothetical protein LOZ60_002699 [Ophidiomyces ophidiicola]KAI1949705.1 hypothetical protein LOZ57_002180 [Ophidiomyces ophidiicola]KAI2006942.1 hypothetical protein LOZ50_002796 [Ophidiomyces ophidiicola]